MGMLALQISWVQRAGYLLLLVHHVWCLFSVQALLALPGWQLTLLLLLLSQHELPS
jgi:hypothetical protein